jgi:hypothetical protein
MVITGSILLINSFEKNRGWDVYLKMQILEVMICYKT